MDRQTHIVMRVEDILLAPGGLPSELHPADVLHQALHRHDPSASTVTLLCVCVRGGEEGRGRGGEGRGGGGGGEGEGRGRGGGDSNGQDRDCGRPVMPATRSSHV